MKYENEQCRQSRTGDIYCHIGLIGSGFKNEIGYEIKTNKKNCKSYNLAYCAKRFGTGKSEIAAKNVCHKHDCDNGNYKQHLNYDLFHGAKV